MVNPREKLGNEKKEKKALCCQPLYYCLCSQPL